MEMQVQMGSLLTAARLRGRLRLRWKIWKCLLLVLIKT